MVKLSINTLVIIFVLVMNLKSQITKKAKEESLTGRVFLSCP